MRDNNLSNTRNLILQKSSQLFLSLGYHKTSMRLIAQEVGISTGPLYFHFKNKAEVFFYICDEAYEKLISSFKEVALSKEQGGVKLRNFYYAYRNFYYSYPQLFEIIHLGLNPKSDLDLPKDLRDSLLQRFQELLLVMEEVIKDEVRKGTIRDVQPRELALYLYSVSEGVFLAWQTGVLERNGISLDRMIDSAIEVIGLGILPNIKFSE